MKQSIVFIIVTYRADKKVLDVLRCALVSSRVIIVDNTKKNLGYGGGANAGIKQALKQGAKWVVVMNQDVDMTKESVKRFTEILKKSSPAIVGPFAGRLDQKRWTTIVPATKMDYISGSLFAIHRKVVDKVGNFYEPYFLYYEEVDFCRRTKRAGFPLRWLPIAGIKHEETVTLGRGSFLHQYYLARNHLLFVERQAPSIVKLYEFVRFPKTVFEHIIQREWGGLLGVFHYFIRRFGPL